MKAFLYVALSCVLISFVQADSPKTKLNIAVVEGDPSLKADKGKTLIKTNLDKYLVQLKGDCDILVLPEYGLTGRTDNQSLAVDLSNSTDEDIKYLTEKALEKKITIVASLLEKDGDDLYSTTLVLNGTTVTKYRKSNLNETESKLKAGNDVVTFKHSSSNATIGLLSGDDILYDEPANKLVNDYKVTTIIHTTSMKSIAPFRTAVSLYAGFAKAHGVNLLVASLNDPSNGISGSGIFQPCKLKATISAKQGTSSIIDTIDVNPSTTCTTVQSLFGGRKLTTDPPLTDLIKNYDYASLQHELIANDVAAKQKCDGSFCCIFNINSTTWNKTESYRLAVSEDQKVCGLLACSDAKNIETCGILDIKTDTTFTDISITTTNSDASFVPYIIHKDLLPGEDLKAATFSAGDKGANLTITQQQQNVISNVIAIGIVAAKSGASSLQLLATSVIAISVLLKHLF